MNNFQGQKNKASVTPKRKQGNMAIPRALREVSNEVHRSRITSKNYVGKEEIPQLGLMDKWESKGIEYLIDAANIAKMKFRNPRVYTEQKKNIYLLANYVYRQKNENSGRASATFTLGQYLFDKGYTEEEIKAGGNQFKLANQVIESGAYTKYGKVVRSADGKRGRQIIGSFYTLFKEGNINAKGEIKGKGTKYKVVFNAPYSDYLEEVMKQESQYYLIPMKLIGDRYVDSNPTLFNFIDYLIYIRGGKSFPIKIANFLKEIGVLDRYIDQEPKKCFEYLKSCLVYARKKYPELLSCIRIYNSGKGQWMNINFDNIIKLAPYSYQDFKKVMLDRIYEKDLRQCFIDFRQKGKSNSSKEPPATSGDTAKAIMRWIDAGLDFEKTKFTREKTVKYINDVIKKVGEEAVRKIFEKTLLQVNPNRFVFLTKTLKELMQGIKREGGVRHIGEVVDSKC